MCIRDRVNDDRHAVVIFGRAAEHRRAADVNVLNRVVQAHIRFRDRRLERIKIHHDQINWRNAVCFCRRFVSFIAANEDVYKRQPYWEAKRQMISMLEFHKLLAAKIESEKLDLEIPKTSLVQVTDPAQPGKSPVKPNKTLNITLGLVFGLIMGVGLAFFIEYLDTSVKTIDDVERAFQAPVLGVIPQNVGHLVNEGPESKHAEA